MTNFWGGQFSTQVSSRFGDLLAKAISQGSNVDPQTLKDIALSANRIENNSSTLEGLMSGLVKPEAIIDAVAEEQIGVELNLASSQEIPNDTETEIIWPAPANNYYDANFIDVSSDATSIYVPVTGWYLMIVTCVWTYNAVGYRDFIDKVDTVRVGNIYDSDVGADTVYFSDARTKRWTKGTQIQIEVYQNSGDALDLTAAQWTMRKILSPKSRS